MDLGFSGVAKLFDHVLQADSHSFMEFLTGSRDFGMKLARDHVVKKLCHKKLGLELSSDPPNSFELCGTLKQSRWDQDISPHFF